MVYVWFDFHIFLKFLFVIIHIRVEIYYMYNVDFILLRFTRDIISHSEILNNN